MLFSAFFQCVTKLWLKYGFMLLILSPVGQVVQIETIRNLTNSIVSVSFPLNRKNVYI